MTVPTTTSYSAAELAQTVEKSRLLSAIPWVRHGVTRRVPGLGLADGNVGYTAPRDESDAWEMRRLWATAIGIDPADLVRVRQVHGNEVRIATELDTARGIHPDAAEAPVGDAIITAEPNVALMTLHADCLAMLIVDPRQRVVAAVHAGWRSTVLDIAGETVRAMQGAFGCNPEHLVAYVGPSIGVDRYEVGDEVIAAWQKLPNFAPAAGRTIDGARRFDLKQANASRLIAAGVPESSIEISPVCTASDTNRWFSHRAQGPLTGRFAAMIAIAEGGI